jgi:hypothetical protein
MIELWIPSIRKDEVFKVLKSIEVQTLLPDKVVMVDNSLSFRKRDYQTNKFEFELVKFGENVGASFVWNLALRSDAEIIGIFSDDIVIARNVIEETAKFLNEDRRGTGIVCPKIVEALPLPETKGPVVPKKVRGKGNAGIFFLKREVAQLMPLIPANLRMFFNDNWLHYWLKQIDLAWIQLTNVYIYHRRHPDKYTRSLKYQDTLKKERYFWDDFARTMNRRRVFKK